jgi:hypothetical protein
MAISRAQMGSQLTGNKMKKKPVKRKALGGLAAIKEGGIANISPAAALAQSIKSGRPEGMLRLSPLAQALGRSRRGGETGDVNAGDAAAAAAEAMAPATRPTLPSRGMKGGGKVRGDGICQRGRTKGRMT